jgi:probable HAF family extracellular repeat protein
MSFCRCTVAATLVAASPLAWAQPTYTVTPLGSLGGSFGVCWGINASGVAVGESQDASGRSRAFRWDSSSGIVDLGTLGGLAAGAYDINDAGTIVGWARNAAGLDRAFVWKSVAGMQAVSGLPPTRPSYAYGINLSGRIVGSLYNSFNLERAFVVDPGLPAADPFPTNTLATNARAVNAAGQFVGMYSISTTTVRGYRGNADLSFDTIGSMRALGISDTGLVAGGPSAYRWLTSNPQLLSIPLFTAHEAWAAGDDGSTVGWGFTATNPRRGFIYTDCFGTRDINTMLVAGSTIEVTAIYDLDAAGRLVGSGLTSTGDTVPVLLTPGSPPCPPNCDCSTGSPLLTPNDFQCFINFFAEGSTRANCDHSVGSPFLTPNDFQCFLNAFAGGCS